MKHLILCTLACTALLGCMGPDMPESFAEKADWAMLQGVEYEQRAAPIATPKIVTVQGRELLGVRSRDGKANVWILLKTESAPFYKQIPAGKNYDISDELVSRLIVEKRVTYTVGYVLQSHSLVRG